MLPEPAARYRPAEMRFLGHALGLALVVLLGSICVVEAMASLGVVPVAHDLNVYVDAARRWLAGDGFYRPEQVAGEYLLPNDAVLYPPVALLLFVPFTLLPAVLWWAIPGAIVGLVAWRHRPRLGGVVLILFILALPTNWWLIAAGNPAIWVAAALALGTLYGWPALGVLLKPSLAPFALVGFWRHSWRMPMVVGAIVSLPFVPMWGDWVAVLMNARSARSGPFYSVIDVPLLLIPLLAWLARTRVAPDPGSVPPMRVVGPAPGEAPG